MKRTSGSTPNTADIIIFSAGFGQGHQSAGQALKEQLWNHDPSLRIEEADLLQLLMPTLSKPLYGSYELMVNRATGMYNYFWEKKEDNRDIMTGEAMTRLLMPALDRYIRRAQPRLAISTFPVCSYYLGEYKKRLHADYRLVTVITDILCRQEWMHPATDLYVVASAEIRDQLAASGLGIDRVAVSGIPVRQDFHPLPSGRLPLPEYEVSPEETVLLVMGGGMGKIPSSMSFYHWLGRQRAVHSLLLTAHNDKFRKRLLTAGLEKNVTVLGFEKDTARLMQGADLLITRGGGITLFEAIASELPMIIYKPTLGQEVINAKYMETHGLARVCYDSSSLVDMVEAMLGDGQALLTMKQALADYNHGRAGFELGARLMALVDNKHSNNERNVALQ